MSKFTNDELIDYVLGRSIPCSREIADAAAADEELAAQIAVMQMMSGMQDPDLAVEHSALLEKRRPSVRRIVFWASRHRRAAILAFVFLLFGGGLWAGWTLTHQPLLEDHFRRRSFDSETWFAARPHVRQEYGYLKLANRGCIISRQEFDEPFELSFRWRWIDLTENPHYSDDLTVVLRTTGTLDVERPFEALDGVTIRFQTYARSIAIKPLSVHLPFATPPGKVPMPSDAWHDIRITDDGERIAVYISGPEVSSEHRSKPVFEVRCSDPVQGRKIAFYNREMLSFTPHESHITDVVVRRLP